MTLLVVLMLDAGIVLLISAFENKSLNQTFNDILTNRVKAPQEEQPQATRPGETAQQSGGQSAPRATGGPR